MKSPESHDSHSNTSRSNKRNPAKTPDHSGKDADQLLRENSADESRVLYKIGKVEITADTLARLSASVQKKSPITPKKRPPKSQK